MIHRYRQTHSQTNLSDSLRGRWVVDVFDSRYLRGDRRTRRLRSGGEVSNRFWYHVVTHVGVLGTITMLEYQENTSFLKIQIKTPNYRKAGKSANGCPNSIFRNTKNGELRVNP